MMTTNPLIAWLIGLWAATPEYLHLPIIKAVEIILVMLAVVISVALLTYAERKVIGWMQDRHGPNQIKIFGLPILKGVAQPFADVIKLLLKKCCCRRRPTSCCSWRHP